MTHLARPRMPEPRLPSPSPEKPFGSWSQDELAERMADMARQEAINRGEKPGAGPKPIEKIQRTARIDPLRSEAKVMALLRLDGPLVRRLIQRGVTLGESATLDALNRLMAKGFVRIVSHANRGQSPVYGLTEEGQEFATRPRY